MYVLQNKIILVKEVHFSPVAASFPKIDSFSLLTNRRVVLKGHFTLWKKTLIQKAYCVYYHILKERRFFYVD